jgi:hypothetical protein
MVMTSPPMATQGEGLARECRENRYVYYKCTAVLVHVCAPRYSSNALWVWPPVTTERSDGGRGGASLRRNRASPKKFRSKIALDIFSIWYSAIQSEAAGVCLTSGAVLPSALFHLRSGAAWVHLSQTPSLTDS